MQEVLPLTAYHAMAAPAGQAGWGASSGDNAGAAGQAADAVNTTIPVSDFHPGVMRLTARVTPPLAALLPGQRLRCFPPERLAFDPVAAGSTQTCVVKVVAVAVYFCVGVGRRT